MSQRPCRTPAAPARLARETLLIGMAALVAAAAPALAQAVPSAQINTSAESVVEYWTPERLRAAVPLDGLVATAPADAETEAVDAAPDGKAMRRRGSPPTENLGNRLGERLFEPPAEREAGGSQENFGTAPFYFTTSRVFPVAATRIYPNSAAGKLFFSDAVHGGNFQCSASAISYRLVVTAGHCVADGSTDAAIRHFYTNIMFVPAFNDGAAPFGQWPAAHVVTTNNWLNSGAVPNPQDVGIVEVQDRVVGGVPRKLGNVTGWLGFWTLWGRQYPNHVTQLGYPCNLDSCGRLAINAAQGVRIVRNNVEIGSAMEGGSSGGPWVQDYGIAPDGAPRFTAGNWVLGTTSYLYQGSPSPMIMGASIFRNAGFQGHGFGDLWAAACAHRAGNC